MSDFAKGIKLAVIAVATVFIALALWPRFEPRFDAAAVHCFPMPDTTGMMPAVKPMIVTHEALGQSEVEFRRDAARPLIQRVMEAAESCGPASCPADAFKAYRSAVFSYVGDREIVTRNLVRENGDDGLAVAREIYGTLDDAAIAEHMRGLHLAGKLDFARFRQYKESAALLALKPSEDYRPCVPPARSAANVSPSAP